MARLLKPALKGHRDQLAQWHTPAAMAAKVAEISDMLGSENFFNQAGVEFLRDAWIAAEFGRCRQSTKVRLVADHEQWPDFEAKDQQGDIERVECVEADEPGRRRGDYYRDIAERAVAGESTVEHDPVEKWIARAQQVPVALTTAILKKVTKSYAGQTSLLVHLNLNEYGIWQKEIEAAMHEVVIPALPVFQSVWILWKGKLYGPWIAS